MGSATIIQGCSCFNDKISITAHDFAISDQDTSVSSLSDAIVAPGKFPMICLVEQGKYSKNFGSVRERCLEIGTVSNMIGSSISSLRAIEPEIFQLRASALREKPSVLHI